MTVSVCGKREGFRARIWLAVAQMQVYDVRVGDTEIFEALSETTARLIEESRQLRAKSERMITDSRRLRRELRRLVEPEKAVTPLRPAA